MARLHSIRRVAIPAALLLAAGLLSGCGKGEIQAVSADALVVDVRTPLEYRAGHYHGAVNIPVDDIEERLDELGDKDAEIIVYCRTGHRSADAKSTLLSAGFTKVYDGGGLRYMESLPIRDSGAAAAD
jgi:phage shock protein E